MIRNALFRLPARVDYRALPWVTYTDPELAQVGLDRGGGARTAGPVRVLRWPFADNDRAHTERDTAGEIKIITGRRGRILGATILGAAAGDLILPWALAISQRLKIGAMANLIVPYPTRGEAGKRAAGSYYTPDPVLAAHPPPGAPAGALRLRSAAMLITQPFGPAAGPDDLFRDAERGADLRALGRALPDDLSRQPHRRPATSPPWRWRRARPADRPVR